MSEPHVIQWKIPGYLPGVDTCKIDRPDIGIVGQGRNLNQLVESVVNYRRANAIPIGLGLAQEVVNAVCEKYRADFPACCVHDDPAGPIEPKTLRYGDVLDGTKALVQGTKVAVSWAAAGFPVVSKEEAERRASICFNCRMNVNFGKLCGGSICGEMLSVIERIVKTPVAQSDHIHSCFICKCYLNLAVWLPLEIQTPGLTDFQKEQFKQVPNCWKKQDEPPQS